MQTIHEKFDFSPVIAESGSSGGFDILAITAGEGNGWHFAAEVLQRSLPLWEQVDTFIDQHPRCRSAAFRARPRWAL